MPFPRRVVTSDSVALRAEAVGIRVGQDSVITAEPPKPNITVWLRPRNWARAVLLRSPRQDPNAMGVSMRAFLEVTGRRRVGRRLLGAVRFVAVFAVLGGAVALGSGTAVAKETENHCITPAGDDLNEILGTPDAFIAPFCTEAHVGDRWRAVLRIQVAGADFAFPAGYVPSQFPLDDDFLGKFVSGRYVVDAGTGRERTYTFSADQLVVQTGAVPDGTGFVRWTTPSLHPLPPGQHSVDEYVTLSADFWDGLGVDPGINLIPAGESLAGSVQFDVVRPG
jgi:hypothetical protein